MSAVVAQPQPAAPVRLSLPQTTTAPSAPLRLSPTPAATIRLAPNPTPQASLPLVQPQQLPNALPFQEVPFKPRPSNQEELQEVFENEFSLVSYFV